MDILAKKSGYESITDLHTNEISVQLKEILENKSYVKWNRHSRERFKFDVIVRNCREGIGSVIDDVLEIIRESSIPDKDIELRMDMLVLLEFILGLKKIDKLIMDKSEYIILVK